MPNFLDHLPFLDKFREKFPKNLFEELNFPPDIIPKPLTELPYENKGIKKRFQDEKKLFEILLMKSFLYRYEGKKIVTDKPIVLFTWVMNDGFGDLATQLEAANVICEAFPDLEVHLISLVDETKKYRVSHPKAICHLIPYKGFERVIIPKNVLQIMDHSSAIFQIPTIYPFADELGYAFTTIGEYGFIDSDWFHPESKTLCMGLHSLEQGLLFPETTHATEEDFYFAYLKSERGYAIYLHALFEKEKEKSEDIRILFIDPLPLLFALQKECWDNYQIKEFVIIDEGNRHVRNVGPKGKIITLEKVSQLSPEQVRQLMQQSKPFIGCRGDRSFSEVITTLKPFFYDLPVHSRPFMIDLLHIVQKKLFYPSLESYIQLILDDKSSPRVVGHKIGDLLLDASLSYGIKKLSLYLQSHFSFNRSLLNLVRQKVTHHFYPEKATEDQLLIKMVIEEKISLRELCKNKET